MPVAPMAYGVILEPGIVRFREFNPPECIYSYKFVGTFFLVHKFTCGKRESVSYTTHSMKNRRAEGLLNPMMRGNKN